MKIGNLIVLTKELLPSIKTTSYAKKIKLKVKAYAEATGIPFTDISPQVTAMSHNNLQTINNENKNPITKIVIIIIIIIIITMLTIIITIIIKRVIPVIFLYQLMLTIEEVTAL